ncbi:MAG TPA: hypothetical protein VEC14_04740, partial [Reyranellaceae bacterium]|nr:hypothetical protein [Reyranellaceae bacterium]
LEIAEDAARAAAELKEPAEALEAQAERLGAQILALGRAYDQVAAEPRGPAGEPRVALEAEEIGQAIVERGGFKDLTGVEVKGRGFGLVKVIWRHGEKAERLPPELRVAREDVLALPEVLRDFAPSQIGTDAAGAPARWEWRVDRPGPEGERRVVYALSRFDDGDGHLVTIFVQAADRAGADAPVSLPRDAGGTGAGPGSPGGVGRVAGDTAREASARPPAGPDRLPAEGNVGASASPVETSRLENGADPLKAEVAALRAKLDAAAKAGDPTALELRAELDRLDAIDQEAAGLGEAYQAAAVCIVNGGGA